MRHAARGQARVPVPLTPRQTESANPEPPDLPGNDGFGIVMKPSTFHILFDLRLAPRPGLTGTFSVNVEPAPERSSKSDVWQFHSLRDRRGSPRRNPPGPPNRAGRR